MLPIALEDRRYFIDDVRISGAGDPHVPFQAADLSRMSKVRGPDVGGREARLPVEEPCLRMQPCVVRVEGDPDVGPGFTQFIESARFSGSGIGRCQDPQEVDPPYSDPSDLPAAARCRCDG